MIGLRQHDSGRVYPVVACACLALFFLANLRTPLINDDGVLYLLLAEQIRALGIGSAMELFDRPLYAWMISAAHSVSGLSLHHSAIALDALLATAMALAFVAFCRQLYGEPRLLPWAALLFLLHPKLNNYWAYVIRDIGYWALLLASFWLLLRHARTPRASLLAGWGICTLLAAGFRPEALLFGLLLPLGLLFAPDLRPRQRWQHALAAYSVLCALLALLWMLPGSDVLIRANFSDNAYTGPGLYRSDIVSAFMAASERHAATVLDPLSRDMAPLSLAGGLLSILVAKTLNTLGPLQCLLLACATWYGIASTPRATRTLYALMLFTALLIPAVFLAYRQFLDSRYVMLVCLLLLAPVARALQWLVDRAAAHGKRRRVGVAIALAGALALDWALGLDRAKPHMIECAAALPALVEPGSRVFSNDKQLAFHSGGAYEWQETHDADVLIAEQRAPLQGVAFWIIRTRGDDSPLAQHLRFYSDILKPLQRCDGRRGEAVTVYALRPAS
jgi:hypothetical protein